MVGLNNNFAEIAKNLEGQIADFSLKSVAIASISLVVLVILSMQVKDRAPKLRTPLFLTISTLIISVTSFLIGSTVYLNVVSDSGGPVHWHADIEYWACGSEIELRDPYKFLSNKIGSATLHEHNDKRIHLEGVVLDEDEDATLGHFMSTIDGSLDKGSITIPVHQEFLADDDTDGDIVDDTHLAYLEAKVRGSGDARYLDLKNGDTCGDGLEAVPGELQVFVYQFNKDNDTYKQTKLDDPAKYTYAPQPNVPPADCVILEFDKPKDYTDKLCNQYGLKDSKRCTEFGVTEFNPKLCDITDVTDYGQANSQQDVDLDEVSVDENTDETEGEEQ